MPDRPERRSSTLSDVDIERIETAFDKRLDSLFEIIGYDTTTPESRLAIRKDHEFVRAVRRAKVKIVSTFLLGVGGTMAMKWQSFAEWVLNTFGGKHP